MAAMWVSLGTFAAVAGVVIFAFAVRSDRVGDPAAVLAELDLPTDAHLDGYTERLAQPLGRRLLLPAGEKITNGLRGLLPGNYLDRLRHKLTVAGLSDRVGPEEFVAMQAVGVAAGTVVGLVLPAVMGWGPIGLARSIGILAVGGWMVPVNWMQRAREKRVLQIKRDLPDILDLLAVSVEAGVGLEGAVDVVTSHFDTPLANEMGRMLREMELGVSRRIGLQHLKQRIAVPEVGNFVSSLIQADALGMPLGRVLHAQATEMRAKRRQWARERAAKLPVKIIFPLMTFIFPALFVVVLGPAVLTIKDSIL